MKPVILWFVLLVAVMLGVAWMNGKFGNTGLVKTKVMGEKSLFFEPELTIAVGKKSEINLMANDSVAPVTGFNIEIIYDPALVRVAGVMVNKDIFDKVTEMTVDANLGKIKINASSMATSSVLEPGKIKLATIEFEGLKTGGMVMTSGRRPEVTIWENNKLVEGDFQMDSFKVSVK